MGKKPKISKDELKGKKVCFISLGCPKALVDVEKMLGLLAVKGNIICYEPEDADVVFINTCSFIEPARQEAEAVINEMLQLKKNNVISHLIVTGCLPQLKGKQLAKQFPEVDGFLAAAGREEIVNFFREVLANDSKEPHFKLTAPQKAFTGNDRARLRIMPEHSAYLRIAEGCNHGCAYCLIPRIRGKLRSKKTTEIIREANELAQSGVKELILIAQDTTDFGSDLSVEHNLEFLLTSLSDVPGIKWIRLMYTYPSLITDGLIEILTADNKVLPYIDIPLQHVNSEILKNMNREYNRKDIDNLFSKIFAKSKDVAVRTTFIIGFPGETEEQFAELLKFVEETPLMRTGIFPYFDEPGTKAYKLPGKLSQEVIDDRVQRMEEVLTKKLLKVQENFIDKEVLVLIDDIEDDNFRGRSYADAPEVDCTIFGELPEGKKVGDFVDMHIEGIVAFEDDEGNEKVSDTFDLFAKLDSGSIDQ